VRLLIGIPARLLVYVCLTVIVLDAVIRLWQESKHAASVAAAIFFPATTFIWPLTHLHRLVFGVRMWTIFGTALIAYPISTFVGGLAPIDGPRDV
jgi:hypothetical protein